MTDVDQTPPDQTPEEQEVRRRRSLEEIDRENELARLRSVLANEAARDFLWRMLVRCHVFNSVFDANHGKMCFAEGERKVGLWLLSEIVEADPNAEMLMRQKANQLAHDAARQEREKRRGRRNA